ncbi:MAG: hypothetical protein DSY77_11525 [Bacteroidetes bacterium]|nr:MAG: hypothetical protein DSY77_11525 [Bacteroidota bacterium]
MYILFSILLAFNFFNELEPRIILGDKVEILVPSDFEIMSIEAISRKYPSKNRPTLVFTDGTSSINLAVNHTSNRITNNELPQALPVFVNQFENIYPTIQWYRKEMSVLNGKEFAVMEFISPSSDSNIYNLMFFTELEGRLLIFSFNCTVENQKEWKSKAQKIMKSTKLL